MPKAQIKGKGSALVRRTNLNSNNIVKFKVDFLMQDRPIQLDSDMLLRRFPCELEIYCIDYHFIKNKKKKRYLN